MPGRPPGKTAVAVASSVAVADLRLVVDGSHEPSSKGLKAAAAAHGNLRKAIERSLAERETGKRTKNSPSRLELPRRRS